MTTILAAIDRITSASSDNAILSTFCEKVKAAGYDITNCGRGPNNIQSTMRSKSCDVMVQIAGGQCPGTFADFNWGTRPGGYYKASKFCIPMCTGSWTNYAKYNPKKYPLPRSAWDDGFSQGLDKSKIVGRTWQQISTDKTNFPRCLGFVEGKTAEELAAGFIQLLGGSSSSSSEGGKEGGGASVLDLIKQVCSEWDPLGPELILTGDTLSVKRTKPSSGVPLTENLIVRNSVSFVDYDANTPNVNGDSRDEYLIRRFGEIPLELEVEDTDTTQVLQVNQRGHNHSIDLKCIVGLDFVAGKWVKLTIPQLGIKERYYYISKSAYQDERVISLTLESAPPSIYVEVPEEVPEEEVAEEGETTEEEEA